jgi:tRNA (guanosine-2'-O-)-methyltransferase|tara:strand:- start:427 stop:945 length:519 start_codon:yes stop_codon:yes gene_type:complete
VKNLDGTGLKRLHRDWRRRREPEVALLLDSVQTPYNVGAILRTAAAYRVAHLWLAGATAPPTHSKTAKTALGTGRYLTWTVCEDVSDAIDGIRAAGYGLVGVELADEAVPIHEVRLPEKACLALGHEERGLSATTLAACDAVAFIPQLGRVGSLNVATAAGIALYELNRRGW